MASGELWILRQRRRSQHHGRHPRGLQPRQTKPHGAVYIERRPELRVVENIGPALYYVPKEMTFEAVR